MLTVKHKSDQGTYLCLCESQSYFQELPQRQSRSLTPRSNSNQPRAHSNSYKVQYPRWSLVLWAWISSLQAGLHPSLNNLHSPQTSRSAVSRHRCEQGVPLHLLAWEFNFLVNRLSSHRRQSNQSSILKSCWLIDHIENPLLWRFSALSKSKILQRLFTMYLHRRLLNFWTLSKSALFLC